MPEQPPNAQAPVSGSEHQPNLPEQLRKQMAEVEALNNPPAAAPEGEPAPAPPAAGDGSQPPAQPVSSIQPPEDEQTWEQRFKSQQGRFDQMLRANQALSDRINELTGTVQAMRATGLQPPQPPSSEPMPPPRYVKDEEVQEYGEEFFDVVGRRAQELYAPEFDELAARLARLEGRVEGVGQVVTTNVKRTMHETLAHEVPNWQAINTSPEFKAWVQIPDPYSGRPRVELLKEAYAGHETNRVVSFFKGFQAEAAGLPLNSQARTTSAPPLAPSNGAGNGSGKPSLEDFAAPGRARSVPQVVPPEKPVYTQAWIAQFYADKLAGKFRGRETDADAVEQDIFRAQHEGRIQL